MGYDTSGVDIAALTSSGDVELFASPITSSPSALTSQRRDEPVWSAVNVTGAATGAPPLSGSIFVSVTPSSTSIDGQAANWGDLFSLTSAAGTSTLERHRRLGDGRELRAHRRRRRHRHPGGLDADAVRRGGQLAAAPGRRRLRDPLVQVGSGHHRRMADRE